MTTPSTDIKENVSGISNLTRLWVENNSEVTYLIFKVGKKDDERKSFLWLVGQVNVIISFFKEAMPKNINIMHINMPLGWRSTIRDSFFSFICYLIRKKYIVHIHGGRFSNNKNTPWIYRILISLSLKKSTAIIVLGEKEKEFIAYYYKILNDKITVLPNCVKINSDIVEKNHGMTINLLYMGRLDREKGLKEIILALLELPVSYRLHIAGEGSDKDWFLDECRLKLDGNYIYHGVVFGELKYKLLSDCDVFLLPSYFEGLPTALLEAMSYGMVSVVTPVGSIPEVITDKENGLFVPVGKYIELKNTIELIYNDKNLFSQLSKNAYSTIEKKYSHIEYIKKLNHTYMTVMNQ